MGRLKQTNVLLYLLTQDKETVNFLLVWKSPTEQKIGCLPLWWPFVSATWQWRNLKCGMVRLILLERLTDTGKVMVTSLAGDWAQSWR